MQAYPPMVVTAGPWNWQGALGPAGSPLTKRLTASGNGVSHLEGGRGAG